MSEGSLPRRWDKITLLTRLALLVAPKGCHPSLIFHLEPRAPPEAMPTYRVQLVCERGPEPVTGEILDRMEETIEVEASEPWDAYRKATMRMTISPSGRLLQGYDADTGEEITPPDVEQVFRPGVFAIESIQGPYLGYTDGDSWNGWATPYFEFDVAERIAEDYVRLPERMKLRDIEPGDYRAGYDEAEDAFLFYEPVNDDEAYYYAQTIAVEGREVKAYAIGAYEWTWEETER